MAGRARDDIYSFLKEIKQTAVSSEEQQLNDSAVENILKGRRPPVVPMGSAVAHRRNRMPDGRPRETAVVDARASQQLPVSVSVPPSLGEALDLIARPVPREMPLQAQKILQLLSEGESQRQARLQRLRHKYQHEDLERLAIPQEIRESQRCRVAAAARDAARGLALAVSKSTVVALELLLETNPLLAHHRHRFSTPFLESVLDKHLLSVLLSQLQQAPCLFTEHVLAECLLSTTCISVDEFSSLERAIADPDRQRQRATLCEGLSSELVAAGMRFRDDEWPALPWRERVRLLLLLLLPPRLPSFESSISEAAATDSASGSNAELLEQMSQPGREFDAFLERAVVISVRSEDRLREIVAASVLCSRIKDVAGVDPFDAQARPSPAQCATILLRSDYIHGGRFKPLMDIEAGCPYLQRTLALCRRWKLPEQYFEKTAAMSPGARPLDQRQVRKTVFGDTTALELEFICRDILLGLARRVPMASRLQFSAEGGR